MWNNHLKQTNWKSKIEISSLKLKSDRENHDDDGDGDDDARHNPDKGA